LRRQLRLSLIGALRDALGLGEPKYHFDPDLQIVACVSWLGPWKRIRYGPTLFAMLPQERMAAFAHEEGHWRLLHSEKRWLLACCTLFLGVPLMMALARRQELAADRYAAERGHADGLISFLLRQPVSTSSSLYPPLALRLAQLRSYRAAKALALTP